MVSSCDNKKRSSKPNECAKKTVHCASKHKKVAETCSRKADSCHTSSTSCSRPHSQGSSSSNQSDGTFAKYKDCYDVPYTHKPQPCRPGFVWQHGKYVKDECGSGIVPVKYNLFSKAADRCKTPLTMYQVTVGQLGKQILCGEKLIARNVNPYPPCNICEYILPPCNGYYRKYDCIKPCEADYVTYKQGKKVFRDRVQRYWEPCLTTEQKHLLDVNTYAGPNVALGIELKRNKNSLPCW